MAFDIKERHLGFEQTRRQWLAWTGGLAASALTLGNVAWAQGGGRKILKVASSHNPTTMDPATGQHGHDHILLFPVFEALISINLDTLQMEPGLAESWTFTDDKTLVLNIRRNVTFHDGEPLDAEAVRFNLERARSGERSRVQIDLVSVDKIEVTGDHQVTIRLKQPDAVLLAVLSDRAGMMSSPKAVTAAGAGYDRAPVGTGPWKLDQWVNAEKLVYSRFDGYWGKKPALDGLDISVIPEINTGLRTVIAKQNHFAFNLAPQLAPVMKSAKLKTATGDTLATFHLYLNFNKPPLDNVKVRLAFCHSIDRDALSKLTQGGLSIPTVQTLPKTHWGYNPELEGTYAYDPKKAKALLAEAGHPNGVDIEIYIPNSQIFQQKGEVLAEQAKASGIKLILMPVATNTVAVKFMGEKLGNAALGLYTGRTDPSQFFSLMFDANSFLNAGRIWGAPDLEEVMAECRRHLDPEKRKVAVKRALKIINENALYVPLMSVPEMDAMTNDVEGYQPNILGKPIFRNVSLAG